MSAPQTATRRGTRARVGPTQGRIPQKHEEDRPVSVAELAYRLYEERGRRGGRHLEDWLEAERLISERQKSTGKGRA